MDRFMTGLFLTAQNVDILPTDMQHDFILIHNGF